jgi:predicted ferric reductase
MGEGVRTSRHSGWPHGHRSLTGHFLERAFGGLDRMYLWHRWSAIAAVVLLYPHYVLVTSVNNTIKSTLGNALGFIALFGLVFLLLWALVPRLPVVGRHIRTNYQRWFTLHRLTGLFVIAGLIHGFLVDPVLQHSTALLVWYLAVAAMGTAAYLYRELLHPFTISSAPQESLLHLAIKGLGDETQRLIDTLQPGVPARVGMAFGMFDYRSGVPSSRIHYEYFNFR